MVVMTLMQHECLRKSTPISNVGKQKLKCTQAPAQSSEFLRHPHFSSKILRPCSLFSCFFLLQLHAVRMLFWQQKQKKQQKKQKKHRRRSRRRRRIVRKRRRRRRINIRKTAKTTESSTRAVWRGAVWRWAPTFSVVFLFSHPTFLFVFPGLGDLLLISGGV